MLEDEAKGSGYNSRILKPCSPVTSVSELHLILEKFGSLVSESPLAKSSGTSMKELDASRIFTLQKSNGLIFSVVDKTIVSKLVVR